MRKLASSWYQRWRIRRRRGSVVRFLKRFPALPGARHRLDAHVVVSLTSYPPRFPHLSKTLKSLLAQITRADIIVLWIAEQDFDALPMDVLGLRDHGLRIETCPDWRSYKKIVPALSLFPSSILVTADDDVFYGPDWLSTLLAAHAEYPQNVIGYRAHMAVLRDDAEGFEDYAAWPFNVDAIQDESDRRLLFPTGMGGILYPPGSLAPQVSDEKLFMDICRDADDVWLFWMARLAGFSHRRVSRRFEEIVWNNEAAETLSARNLFGGENDIRIKAMFDRFGLPAISPALAGEEDGLT